MRWVKLRLRQLVAGLITLDEFNTSLDALGIRGEIRESGGFIGYDYTNQVWIDIK